MRIATIEADGKSHVVVVDGVGENYWNIDDILPGFKGDMLDLIRAVPEPGSQLKPVGSGRSLAGHRLMAPMSRTDRNLFLVGKNYHEHAKEFSGSGFDSSAEVASTSVTVCSTRTRT